MAPKTLLCAAMMGGALAATAPTASAGPEDYIGEIMLVGFNFCPRYTLPADGRLLSISENTALFSLYGTMYGGDGRTTFGLPDLRGRTIVGQGQGAGLSHRAIGARGGTETIEDAGLVSVPGNANPKLPLGGVNHAVGGDNMQPFQVLNYCVVTVGVYPSRN